MNRSKFRASSLLSVCLLVVAACGGSDDAGDTDTSTSAGVSVPSATVGSDTGGSAPAASEEIGDTLKIGVGVEPQTLDPHKTRAGGDEDYIGSVFERLLYRDIDGKLVPGLAESYEVSTDGLSVTFDLRDNVTFHNGEAMTAEDVIFSFERFRNPDFGNSVAFLLENVTGVEAPDEDTVVVTFAQPDPGFVLGRGFATIVPKDYLEEHGDDYFAEHPVGTGAAKFVEQRIGESYTLERFDGYWGDTARWHTFVFTILPDANSRVAAIQAGAVDFIAKIPPQNLDQLSSNDDLTVVEGFAGENVWLKFGTIEGDEPWADPLVRQAMDFAIDKQAIIDTVLNGLGVTYMGVTPLNAGFDRAEYTTRPYDPDKARELLAEAGYPDGFDFNLVTSVNGRLAASEQTAQAMAGYLNDVGINTTVETLEFAQYLDAYQEKRGSNEQGVHALNGDQYTWDPAYRMQVQLQCDAPYSHLCDPVIDEAIGKISTELDPTAREDLYLDAYQYVQDQAYEIWIYSSKDAFAMRKGVCWTPSAGSPFVEVKKFEAC